MKLFSYFDHLPISPWAIFGITFCLYWTAVYIYRLYFHPLAKFPGPKIAAASLWYEFYYDCLCRGQYLFKIKEMHEKYGPVVRINPYELHFSDPDFFNTIYSQTERRDAWGWRKKGFGIDVSTLTTLEHDLHRKRRSALNPLFSKQRIVKLQPVIQNSVDALVERVRLCGIKDEVINLKLGFAALTADVAMDYFFGKSQNKLSVPDFDYKFHDAIQSGFNNMLWMNHFPWVMDTMTTVAHYTPSWVIKRYFSGARMTTFIAAQRDITIQVRESLAKAAPEKEESATHTMFDQILASKLPPEEKSFRRLVQEGGLMVGAATVSTAWSLSVVAYCMVANPSALARVKEELAQAFPGGADTMHDLSTLEHLPYFTAVINEGLRIGIGASHRSPRISPHAGIPFTDKTTGKKWYVPAGTPMCMSHPLLFRDPSIFPDPTTFRPERWLENPGLEKYQFAFSKGTRACIGINLAWAELYLMIAHLFARFGSEGCEAEGDLGKLVLFETDNSDVECVGDGGVALVRPSSKGIRFRVVLNEKGRAIEARESAF